MLVKKGDLVRHKLFGFTGIVIQTVFLDEPLFCEVFWQLKSDAPGLTKDTQKRPELIEYLEVLNGKKKLQEG